MQEHFLDIFNRTVNPSLSFPCCLHSGNKRKKIEKKIKLKADRGYEEK